MIQNKALCFFCMPYDELIHSKIEKAIIQNEYTQNSLWGFRIHERRKGSLYSSYIEKQTYIERVTDPFGSVTEFDRTIYHQIDFQLNITSPHILIFKPPKNYRKVINQLAQFADYVIAVENKNVDLFEWIKNLQRKGVEGVVTKARIDEIRYDKITRGKLDISGEKDIKERITELLDGLQYRLKNIKLVLNNNNEISYVELFANGKIIFPKPVELNIFKKFYEVFSLLAK